MISTRKEKFFVWSIPEMVFDDISRLYGKKKELKVGNAPKETRTLDEIFWEYDFRGKKVEMNGLICLSIFHDKNNNAFFFWPNENIKSYSMNHVKDCYFDKSALIIRGARLPQTNHDTDSLYVEFPDKIMEIDPVVFFMGMSIIASAMNAASDQRFIKVDSILRGEHKGI